MGSLIRFPQIRKSLKAREEACYWLVSLDEGLSESEQLKLEEWLAADPSHGDVLVEMAQQWDEQNVLSELSEVFPLEHHNAAQASPPRYRWAAAALVLAMVGLSLVSWMEFFSKDVSTLGNFTGDSQSYVGEGTYRTAIGERLIIRLSDGSAITLNTDTSLEVDYSPENRIVLLHRGEASFDVAPDAGRPFEVHAGEHVIRALGTVFNVRLGTQNNIELMVNEGRIEVTAPSLLASGEATLPENEVTDSSTEIGANEMAIIKSGDAIIRGLKEDEIETKLAWKRGMLIFRGEPLQSVIEDVRRYTTIEFVIADASIRDIRVGGYFRTDDIEGLLLALEESFGVMPTRVDEDLVILRRR